MAVTHGCRPVPFSNLEPVLPHICKGLQCLNPLLVEFGSRSDVVGFEGFGEGFIILLPDEVVWVLIIVIGAFRPVVAGGQDPDVASVAS